MKLTLLSVTSFLTLLGIFSGLVILLYLVKLKRKTVLIPFSPLWEEILSDIQTSSFFKRLKRLISLLIALLIILALTAAISGPMLTKQLLRGRNIVVILDCSASMKSTDVLPNRFQAALLKAHEIIEQMNENDTLMVLRMDHRVTPLSPLTSDKNFLRSVLKGIGPADTGAEIEAAIVYAVNSLKQKKNAVLYLITDGAFPRYRIPPQTTSGKAAAVEIDLLQSLSLAEMDLHYVKIGDSPKNLAITGFNVRRYLANKKQYEIFIQVKSFYPKKVKAMLYLKAGDNYQDARVIEIPPLQEVTKIFSNLPTPHSKLSAHLEIEAEKDFLAVDDTAYACLSQSRPNHILFVSAGNLFLEAALLADENVTYERIPPADYTAKLSAAYSVTIFDKYIPPVLPRVGNFFYIAPPQNGSGFDFRGKILDPEVLELTQDPILSRFLSLTDVNIKQANYYLPAKNDQILIWGTRGTWGPKNISLERYPLLFARKDPQQKRIVSAFDFGDSDLPLRVAFPLLLSHIVEWFSEESSDFFPIYRTGEQWVLPVNSPDKTVSLTDPKGQVSRQPVVQKEIRFTSDQVGFYQVVSAQEQIGLALNLANADESDIQPAQAIRIGQRQVSLTSDIPKGEFQPNHQPIQTTGKLARFGAYLKRALFNLWIALVQNLWMAFVFGVIGIIIIEWYTYHRRITV